MRCVSVGVGENEGVGIFITVGENLAPEVVCKRDERWEYCFFAVAQVTAKRRLSWFTVSYALACLCI